MSTDTQDIMYCCPVPVVQQATAMAKAGAMREVSNYDAWNSPWPKWYCKKAQEAVQAGFTAGRGHYNLAQTLLVDGREDLLASMFRTLEGDFPRDHRVLDPIILLGIRAGMAEGPFPFGALLSLSSKAKQLLEHAGYTVPSRN